MPETENDTNNTLEVTIQPAMTVFWGRSRCWHGDKVKIAIRSSFIPDGTAVELKISTKGGNVEIDTIKDQKITGSKLDYDYTIAWQKKPIPPGQNEFIATAKVQEPDVTATTAHSLLVDLSPPVFSF
jgi:hypothetical protein